MDLKCTTCRSDVSIEVVTEYGGTETPVIFCDDRVNCRASWTPFGSIRTASEISPPAEPKPTEFRAVLTCVDSGWCTYCNAPSGEIIPGTGPVDAHTAEDAMEYGQIMARNVYGASAHSVRVQGRTTNPWKNI